VFSFPKWNPGEAKKLDFELLVTGRYESSTLPLKVVIREKYGKYAQNKDITLTLNQLLADNRTIDVAPRAVSPTAIADVQLRSDVDRDIPQTGKANPHRFAIIIGNQDYHSQQRGLRTEQDVPFAAEDARMFKEYCEKVLGVEAKNISFLTDATAAKMKQEIDFITLLAARDPQAEILFYYAGHGLPDEQTKVPYLIPVDVNASNLSSAIALCDLYQKLSATNAQRVTVFLDACFSGGGRDMGLLASRGVRVTPKKEELTGNLVVFSATSENQTALPYWGKQHGMFTYFLLKKLQESRGTCSYAELERYLDKQVGENSLRENRKEQTPEVNTSRQVADTWKEWKF
ncbi:MAG: caspase family protein, partial [Bacteroidales bacterium]|nr:caspase family protein [Bacteroidales bacterium]